MDIHHGGTESTEKMIGPASLQAGDLVAIVPTARAITREELNEGIALLEGWGLRVSLGAGVGRKHFQFAGTDAQRAADLQRAIDDPQVKAIWCARGGYGTVRLMDRIDLSPLRRSPKWIIGFSDITVLHNAMHNMGLCSLHAQMPYAIGRKSEATRESLRQALFGEPMVVRCALSEQKPGPGSTQRPGTGEGLLVGGNLSMLYSLRGTPYDIDPAGKILLLEDLDELLYHVDRMVQNLRAGGWFRDLAGLVVGGMSDMHDKDPGDPFGRTAEEIIAEAVGEVRYPVCYHFPTGHQEDNRALIFGANAKLEVTATEARLGY